MSKYSNQISSLPTWLKELVDEDLQMLQELEDYELSKKLDQHEFDDPEFPRVKYGTKEKTQATES